MSEFLRKVRVALTPRNRLLKTELDSGVVVYGKNQKGYGGRGIYVYREAIEPEFAHFTRFLDPGDVFLDIGASTGIYTLQAAQRVGAEGVVLSIEPFPEVLAALHQSIQANGFENVRLRSFCLGARTEATRFWMNLGNPHSYGLVQHDNQAGSFSALAVALDDLWQWEGLDRLDYVKIDVEGAEEQVLLGGAATLARHRPILQMEVNISDVGVDLPDYVGFHAPESANKIFMPRESQHYGLPGELGWQPIA